MPKSTRNAAKIYYRILQDGKKVSDRFRNSTVVRYLASMPQESIDELFNPYNIKEKWMKFFRTGNQRALIDNERALKNDYTDSFSDFVRDQMHSFTDK